MIERTKRNHWPMPPPTNEEILKRWEPLFSCFRARELSGSEQSWRYELKPQQEQK